MHAVPLTLSLGGWSITLDGSCTDTLSFRCSSQANKVRRRPSSFFVDPLTPTKAVSHCDAAVQTTSTRSVGVQATPADIMSSQSQSSQSTAATDTITVVNSHHIAVARPLSPPHPPASVQPPTSPPRPKSPPFDPLTGLPSPPSVALSPFDPDSSDTEPESICDFTDPGGPPNETQSVDGHDLSQADVLGIDNWYLYESELQEPEGDDEEVDEEVGEKVGEEENQGAESRMNKKGSSRDVGHGLVCTHGDTSKSGRGQRGRRSGMQGQWASWA